MNFADRYLEKHLFLLPQIKESVSGLLRFCIVIPVYLEEELQDTLESILENASFHGHGEVLLIFNHPESDTEQNKAANYRDFQNISQWCKRNSEEKLKFIPAFVPDLPEKHAGAGLARKIGMDLALHRFNRINRPDGFILSLDADTQVDNNYFTAIDEALNKEGTKAGGCIIRFAHALEGLNYSDEIYEAIILYELQLRYYKNILQHIGFPYAMYTIGSCFGVRAGAYARHGGMNRKKAGEDFYFLNKLFPHEKFIEVNKTCVHPSPRPSLKVPFGTGPVIYRIINSDLKELFTFNPRAFYDLGKFFASLETFFKADVKNINSVLSAYSLALQEFLTDNSFIAKLIEIQQNTASIDTFRKRFFLWFDGFRIVKYLNYVHRNDYVKIPVQQAVSELLESMNIKAENSNKRYLLDLMRILDSGQSIQPNLHST